MASVSFHKLAKQIRKAKRKQTMFDLMKTTLFEFDMYAYTPTLMDASFSTWISLLTSLLVTSLFLFCMGYTTYLWASTAQNLSEGQTEHNNQTVLIPPAYVDKETLPLPTMGVMLLMGDGTSPSILDTSVMQIIWQQNTICNGNAVSKFQDVLPQMGCAFSSPRTGKVYTNTTVCLDVDAAPAVLAKLRNTANDPCKIAGQEEGPYHAPRIAGTFYDTEYSYLTASIRVNATRLLTDPVFTSNVYSGSAQLFLLYNYASTSSLQSGKWPQDDPVAWSWRVNLLNNVTMKWEVTLRARSIQAKSYWWDIPQLDMEAIDYSVQAMSVSQAYVSLNPGTFVEVAKVYLKFDDRDTLVTMDPYTNLFALFSDWGGFLSILVAVGVPALMFNHHVFRSTVGRLMKNGRIAFDESVRKARSEAIAHSYAHTVRHVSMTASRGGSLPADIPAGILASLPSPLTYTTSLEPTRLPTDGSTGGQDPGGGVAALVKQPWMVSSNKIIPAPGSSSGRGPRVSPEGHTKGYSGQGYDVGVTTPKVQEAPITASTLLDSTQAAETLAGGSSGSEPGSTSTVTVAAAGGTGSRHSSSAGAAAAAAAAGGGIPGAAVAVPQVAAGSVHVQAAAQPGPVAESAGPTQPSGTPLASMASASGRGSDSQQGLTQLQLPQQQQGGLTKHNSVAFSVEGCADSHRMSIELPPAPVQHMAAVASIIVDYQNDIFEDSDEDENDFDDVVRHCTSECHALYHLRQVVKLVQHERSFLTCGLEHMHMVDEPYNGRQGDEEENAEEFKRRVPTKQSSKRGAQAPPQPGTAAGSSTPQRASLLHSGSSRRQPADTGREHQTATLRAAAGASSGRQLLPHLAGHAGPEAPGGLAPSSPQPRSHVQWQ